MYERSVAGGEPRVTERETIAGIRLVADLAAGADAGAPRGRDVFTIRDLTKEFGGSARTLRFYEEKGLLDPARRGEQRLYTRRDRARLAYVLAGKAVGLSLEAVRELLDLFGSGKGPPRSGAARRAAPLHATRPRAARLRACRQGGRLLARGSARDARSLRRAR